MDEVELRVKRFFCRDAAIIAALCAAGLIVRLALFSGYQGQDDRIYIFYAEHLASTGHVPVDVKNQWIGRIGGWVPVAGSIRAFGASELSLASWSLVCSLALIATVYLLGRLLFDRRIAISAGILAVAFPLEIIYSTTDYVDVPAGFWIVLSLYFFLKQCRKATGFGPGLLSGVALGIAYLCRETAIFAIPPVALISISYAGFWKRAGVCLAGFGLVLISELIFWQFAQNDPLYRVHALMTRAEVQQSAAPENNEETSAPVTSGWAFPGPWRSYRSKNTFLDAALMFLVNEEFALYYVIGWPVLLYQTIRRDRATKDLRIYVFGMALLLLFFPLTGGKYTLARDPRYYVCITGPTLLCLAAWVRSLSSAFVRRAILATLLVSGLAAVTGTSQSRQLGAKRLLHDFCTKHAGTITWCPPNDAAAVAVFSRFTDVPPVGVQFLCSRRESVTFENFGLFRPDVPTAETQSELTTGFVVLPRGARVVLPSEWEKVEELADRPSPMTEEMMRALRAVGLPSRWVQRLRPGGGEEIDIYAVRGGAARE